MDMFLEHLKKHRLAVVIIVFAIVLFAVVGVPLFINWAFSKPAWCDFFAVDWDAEDALAYYGSVLSFIGTVSLGAITVLQTRKVHKQTDTANNISTDALEQTKQSNGIAQAALGQAQRANDLAAEMQKLERAKFVSLVSMEQLTTSKHGIDSSNYPNPDSKMSVAETISMVSPHYRKSNEYYHVDIRFKNDSDFPILHISANAWDRRNNKALDYGIKPDDRAIYIPPKKELCIRFLIPTRAFIDYKVFGLTMQFAFTNVYDYTSIATLTIEDLTVNGTNTECTYQLEKITDASPASLAESDKK